MNLYSVNGILYIYQAIEAKQPAKRHSEKINDKTIDSKIKSTQVQKKIMSILFDTKCEAIRDRWTLN